MTRAVPAGVAALLALVAVAARPRAAPADERVLSWPPSAGRGDLSPAIEWFDEGQVPLDPAAGITAADERRFQPTQGAAASLGFRTTPVWFRFRVNNQSDLAGTAVLELGFTPTRADLYRQRGSQLTLLSRSGTSLPFDARPVRDTQIAFPLTIDPNGTSTCLLRLESSDVIWTRATVWSEPAFAEFMATRGLLRGLFYGLLLVMIIYNGFLYVSTREQTYLLYVFFETATLLLQGAIDKLTFQYLWPRSPLWADKSEQLFALVTIFAAILFTMSFLDLARHAPRIARALRGLAVAASVLAVASAITAHALLKGLTGVFVIACLLSIAVAGLISSERKLPNGRFFLLGWIPLLYGAVLAVLAGLGFVSNERGFEAFKLGAAAEATILALALANRINRLRREREHADAVLLAARAAQSWELEQRVAARTQQLTEAFSRLKSTQEKLIRQERLTSLAGMVAGMAHEVGNPLNFAQGGADVLREQIADLGRTWQSVRETELVVANAGGGTETAGTSAEQMNRLLTRAGQAVALVSGGLQRIGKIMTNLRGYMHLRMVDSRPTDLVAEIESTLAMVEDTLVRQGVTVLRRLAPLPLFRARPGELNQVFVNLVLNACGAMSGGGRIEITTRADPAVGIEVAFADTGPGIPPDLREAIFEPFFSERASDGVGTGLGLYLSREIVARHGGQLVLLDSERGACFAVRLPLPTEAD